MTHIIPPGEDHLHALSKLCPCNPIIDINPDIEDNYALLCTHLPLTINLEVLPEQPKEMDSLFG